MKSQDLEVAKDLRESERMLLGSKERMGGEVGKGRRED